MPAIDHIVVQVQGNNGFILWISIDSINGKKIEYDTYGRRTTSFKEVLAALSKEGYTLKAQSGGDTVATFTFGKGF